MDTKYTENVGLSLLKKGQKGLVRAIFSRFGIVVTLLLLQVGVLFAAFYWFGSFLPHVAGGTVVFIVFMVLYLLNSTMDPTAKITWLVIIMLLPVFGGLLFWYTRSELGHRAMKARVAQLRDQTRDAISQNTAVEAALVAEDPGVAGLARYIRRSGCYPVYDGTDVTYFPQGEDMFRELLIRLEEAERFIFLEFYIVDEGLMWGKILEILARKAKAGVDVRVMYDGMCEFMLLPRDYPERLQELGIRCKVFSPVAPFVSTHYNYRDHRKILVIDGHTAFTGGVNLADEYINHITRFGHWKDTAVMLRGPAVQSFTMMFLQQWGLSERKQEFETFLAQKPKPHRAKGYVIPYGDCPLDENKVGEKVYMDILNRARHFVHIMTPYLILDGELETALKFAAERGVDVRLILPGIPDKKSAYALAKTHYRSLLTSGVKLYEYTPGFVHAKVMVADGKEAVVGTINLDYRSLYHHFECAAYLWGMDCIQDIEADFRQTMEKCTQVTRETLKREKLPMKLAGFVLKAVAPLL